MKKLYLLLTAIAAVHTLSAQDIAIADANLKTKLLAASPTANIAFDANNVKIKIDTNNDGIIQLAEASAVYQLDVSAANISALSGLEEFPNLHGLTVSNNPLVNLDMTGFSNLIGLGCNNCQLTSLNVANLPALLFLDCSYNSLTSLSLPASAQLDSLVANNNAITALDLTYNPALTMVNLSTNALTSLNVSGLSLLYNLNCQSNNLQSLNLSGLSSLVGLTAYDNPPLETIDFTGTTSLMELALSVCSINTLDLSGKTSLVKFTFLNMTGTGAINNFNFAGCTGLQELYINGSNAQQFELSGLTSLAKVQISNNDLLTSVNMQGCTAAKQVDCFNNALQNSLNFTGCTALEHLSLNSINLPALDVSASANIKYLYFTSPLATSVTMVPCPDLETIMIANTNISSFNFSGFPNLKNLTFSNSQLTDIDLTANTKILNLNCVGNQIHSLDVSHQTMINQILCSNNPLTTLNIKNGKTEAFNAVSIQNIPDLQYVCADDAELDLLQDKLTQNGYSNTNINSYCNFVPGGTFYTFSGTNHWDTDNNGCSAADPAMPNLRFTVSGAAQAGTVVSDDSGHYSIPVQAGFHTLTPVLENPAYFSVSPASSSVSFPSAGSQFAQDFCITPNGSHPDMEVYLLQLVPARPGFNAIYKLVCRNKGNLVQSGAVTLQFNDDLMNFTTASEVPVATSFGNLSWTYADLQPFDQKEILLTFLVNTPMDDFPVVGGTALDFTASLSLLTDDMSSDNIFHVSQTVVNSFDPNDKTCLEGTTILPEMAGKYVHYLIRFENTGTFAAQNIVVKDVIDTTKFDVSSLVPLDGSHPFVTRIAGTNQVEFIFENINLPFEDNTNDGYVAFKIKTKPTLSVNSSFSNTAGIYFDYNFPIVTNTATTTLAFPLGATDFPFENYFTLYPNPAKDALNIKAKADVNLKNIEVYNTLGQLVLAVPNANRIEKIDVSNLTTGSYFIKITSDKGSSNAKFIKD